MAEIAQFLIETLSLLLGVALLTRVLMNWIGLPARNPLAQFVLALTDWLVRPLRRVIPAVGRLDVASLLAAYLIAVVAIVLVQLVVLQAVAPERAALGGIIRVIHWALSGLIWLTVLYALLSWINPLAPIAPAVAALLRPFLEPFRRIIPLVGGVDLSPMALILVLFILQRLLDGLRF